MYDIPLDFENVFISLLRWILWKCWTFTAGLWKRL